MDPQQPNQQQPAGQPQPPTGAPVQPAAQPTAQYAAQPAGQTAQQTAQQTAAQSASQTASQPSAQPAGQYPPPGAYATESAPKKDRSSMKTFLIAFAGALVACVISLGGFAIVNNNSGYTIQETNSGITINANTEEMTLSEAVAAKTLPSVVNINVYASASSQGMSLFGQPLGNTGTSQLQQTSLGSGVVLTADGYILTNNHVVDGAQKLEVVAEGETYEAKLVGTDASSDLAVIKVDGATLKPIEIGNSSELVVGEWVMAAGSPFGMEQTVTTGIVSAVNRSYADETTGAIYTNMIQTDAAINSGNSGGALVDAEGKLIGINTLIMSTSGTSSGVGFAIPVDYAFGIAEQIIQGKAPSHAQLGVSLITVNDQIAARFGLSVDEGAYINSLVSGGAAEKAGLTEGDVIVAIDGDDIESASDVILAVRSHAPNDKVQVTYLRDGKEATAEVTLGTDAQ